MPEQPRPGEEPAADPTLVADPTLIADPTLVAEPAPAASGAAPAEVGSVPLETVLGLDDGDPLHGEPPSHGGQPIDHGYPEPHAGLHEPDAGMAGPGGQAEGPGGQVEGPGGQAEMPGGQAEMMVPPPPPPPPPGAIPAPPGAGPLPGGPSVVAGTRPGPAGRLGQVRQLGEGMTASQLASRLQLSSHAITVNDMVGALGALLIFIGYFVDIAYAGSRGLSLASEGGFWAALVPVFAPVSAAALMVPPARRMAGIWLALAAAATGIALGSRNLAPFGYGAGWWLCFFGGIALCYAWVVRTTGRTDGPPPR